MDFLSFVAHALPMFREKRAKSMKKMKQEMRADPSLSKMPDPPVTGPGECSAR